MPTGDQQRDGKTAHSCSLAHLVAALGLATLVACSSEPALLDAALEPEHCLGTHDEDSDGIGDSCDVCPTVPDPLQRDTTEVGAMQFPDGIGDLCDPRVARNGDLLAARHLFDDPADTIQWLGEGWTITSDVARAIAPARWSSRVPVPGDGLYVRAIVTVIAWLGDARIEVVADGDGATLGSACAVVRTADGSSELVAQRVGVEAVTQRLGMITGPFAIVGWRAIDVDRVSRFVCRFEVPGELPQEIRIETNLEDASGQYAFAATGALVDVSSVLVYTFPVNPCVFSTVPRCEPDS